MNEMLEMTCWVAMEDVDRNAGKNSAASGTLNRGPEPRDVMSRLAATTTTTTTTPECDQH